MPKLFFISESLEGSWSEVSLYLYKAPLSHNQSSSSLRLLVVILFIIYKAANVSEASLRDIVPHIRNSQSK